MKHRPFPLLLVMVAIVAISQSILVHASGEDEPFPHIRPTDGRLRTLLNDAARSSPTVRALIERISVSDVVVYLACERDPAVRAPARLNFVVAAGGVRYVLVRMKLRQPRYAAIALLAHELQHAAEIADRKTIVDEESLGHEYERMGGRRGYAGRSITFDTKSAVEIGDLVLEELSVNAE